MRGFVVESKVPAEPMPAQRPDMMGDAFLPDCARRRLRETKPAALVVVPDGALHKMPVEALPLRTDAGPIFAVDELPPVVYCASPTVLVVLAERDKKPVAAGAKLLTLGDPAYPEADASKPPPTAAEREGRDGGKAFYGFLGQLPRLPASRVETRKVRQHFAREDGTSLEGAEATEANFRAGVKGKRFIHVAAHGFADERFGNLFAALALAPPPPDRVVPQNDGLLTLREINELDLSGCECAVPSACVTNVGPQRPLEAGVTLAGAFLNAGRGGWWRPCGRWTTTPRRR